MFQNRTILLIDDEAQIRRVLRAALSGHGANILDAQSGEEALDILRRMTIDIVLLDLNMPGMGGLETCRAIRAGWDVPIIVVSVHDTHDRKVEALDAGADDFVTKPFAIEELMARMRAALRRTGFATSSMPQQFSAPDLEINFAERRVTAGGRPVRLTPTEFDILRYLVANANKPVPHRRLLQAIWGPEHGDQVEYLRVFINQLRKKIEPAGERPAFIQTEPRIGYRFVTNPSREATNGDGHAESAESGK
jgi:two-component system KDP operon response regulator KdpE